MDDVRTRTVVCCYRGRVGSDLSVLLMSATTWKQNRSTGHLQQTQISSNSSTIAADNSMGKYIIHYSIELIIFSTEYILFNNCNFNLVYRYSLSANLTLSITVKRLPDAVVTVVLCSWRWVIVTPKTCRAVVRLNKLCYLCI